MDGGRPPRPVSQDPALQAALEGVSAAFASLGRVFLCVDAGFRVLHASSLLDRLLGRGAAGAAVGRPVADLLGTDLFGSAGTLRQLLLAGERREGWRSMLTLGGAEPRLVSVTAAPFHSEERSVCDPRVAYIVVMRPAEEDQAASAGSPFPGLIGRSPAMERVFRLVENLEHSEATVLLTGESGTGKEVLAWAVHAHSPRRSGPFVAVNCGALPGELLESELFGHVRGAFTGAERARPGLFEQASGGTLFLDEVGDMPLSMQARLLRVVEEGMIRRVGGERPVPVDVRLVGATHRDLGAEVRAGRFRQDLLFRLQVLTVELPPLRERPGDVPLLVAHILARIAADRGRAPWVVDDEAMGLFERYAWPGNVRELQNTLQRLTLLAGNRAIGADLIASEPTLKSALMGSADVGGTELTLVAAERGRIREALAAAGGNRRRAAQLLGVSRATLYRKLDRHAL